MTTVYQKSWLLVLLGLLFFAGLFAGRWLLPTSPQPVADLQVAQWCDITSDECAIQGPGMELTLALSPPPVVMQPFSVQLTDWGDNKARLQEVIVSFIMEGMDMGHNRYRLDDAGDGIWKGQVILPVCAAGRRDWVAELSLRGSSGDVYRARIPFVTR